MTRRCPYWQWFYRAFFGGIILFHSHAAQAGMTVYGLKDVVRMRLEDVSFFIFLFFLCGLLFKLLWNHGAKGFSFLPRIGYLQALCLCTLLGLGMLLILTMISGIREVLTPGAWRRQGSSYRLTDPSQEPERRRSLEQLRTALFDYARAHEGRFPPHDFVAEIPEKIWESPDDKHTHYLYSGGLTTNNVKDTLALEPPAFGDRRFVLFVDGRIEQRSQDELNAAQQEKR